MVLPAVVATLGVLVGLAAVGWLLSSDGNAGLTTASPDLTLDGLLTVLLTQEQVEGGFMVRAHGVASEQDVSKPEELHGAVPGCQTTLDELDGLLERDGMSLRSWFDRSDGSQVTHRVSPLTSGDVSFDELSASLAECEAQPLDVVGPSGEQGWSLELSVQRRDSLGEDALVISSLLTSPDGGGQVEAYEAVWARGGLMSSVEVVVGTGTPPDDEDRQRVDREFLDRLADDVDERIVAGM